MMNDVVFITTMLKMKQCLKGMSILVYYVVDERVKVTLSTEKILEQIYSICWSVLVLIV